MAVVFLHVYPICSKWAAVIDLYYYTLHFFFCIFISLYRVCLFILVTKQASLRFVLIWGCCYKLLLTVELFFFSCFVHSCQLAIQLQLAFLDIHSQKWYSLANFFQLFFKFSGKMTVRFSKYKPIKVMDQFFEKNSEIFTLLRRRLLCVSQSWSFFRSGF